MDNNLAKEIFDDICTENGAQIDSEKRDRIAVQFNESMQIAEDMEFEQHRRSPNTLSDFEMEQKLKKELKQIKDELREIKHEKERNKFSLHELASMRNEAVKTANETIQM